MSCAGAIESACALHSRATARTKSAPAGAPTPLDLLKTLGRSRACAIVRDDSAAISSSALAVPKALTAATTATRMPAAVPIAGAMASANGAPLFAAIALGRSASVARVASR